MCIVCELSFWNMIDALPAEQQERILCEQAERFACEAPKNDEASEPPPPPQANAVERKP
jgi:hypothetical protein